MGNNKTLRMLLVFLIVLQIPLMHYGCYFNDFEPGSFEYDDDYESVSSYCEGIQDCFSDNTRCIKGTSYSYEAESCWDETDYCLEDVTGTSHPLASFFTELFICIAVLFLLPSCWDLDVDWSWTDKCEPEGGCMDGCASSAMNCLDRCGSDDFECEKSCHISQSTCMAGCV